MADTRKRVLVVDDSALMRKVIKGILSDAGLEVHTARNGLDALDQIQRIPPDVITLDINMPELDGLSCLTEIMTIQPTPVVMVSSLTDRNAMATLEAMALGAVDVICKPGGTVSLNLATIAPEIVAKVSQAADARVVRARGLANRLRSTRQRIAAEPKRPPAREQQESLVEVVLIGSSTGGPALLATLLSELPADFPAPVVVAQHIPASFTAALAKRLDQCCPMSACEVTGPTVLRPGTIYIGRGDADIVLARRDGELIVRNMPVSAQYRWHPSVDRLVASARQVVAPDRTIAVLLTGMGDDGAHEIAGLRADGGRTIAESEETAVVWGMPGELAKRGGATCVLAADRIPAQLLHWTSRPGPIKKEQRWA